MAHRQEIKQKQALQAQIQHAFAALEKRVASWLACGPGDAADADSAADHAADSLTYTELPVVAPGAGLSSIEEPQGTIGDFLSTGTKKGILKPQTKAMAALSNRMRSDRREKMKKELTLPKRKKNEKGDGKQKVVHESNGEESDSDSDDERKLRRARSVATRQKSKRPF